MNGFRVVERSSAMDEARSAIRNARVAHAYLIIGEKGVGKRSFARFLAAMLLSGEEHPCGECPSCRKVFTGSHADLVTIAPSGKSILIEQVRSALLDAYVKPFEAECKVFIIEQADKMTVQAQNCILKTLEEPPQNVFFILTAESVRSLLPTVLSRCRPVMLQPVPTGEIAAELADKHNVPQAQAMRAAQAAGGSIGRAEELLTDEQYWARRDKAAELVEAVCTQDPVGATDILSRYYDDLEGYLAVLEGWLRDLLLCQNAAPELAVNRDCINRLEAQSERVSSKTILRYLRAVAETIARLGRHTSAAVSADALLLEMMEENNGIPYQRSI